MATLKELSKRESAMAPGHRMCPGCTAPIIVKLVTIASTKPLVVSCATGCLEVSSTIYPFTAWNCSFIHSAFENSAATLSGVEAAYQALRRRGKVKDEIKFIAFGGDGGTYDIGLQSLSGAMERGHDMLYVCLPPETEIILEDGSIVRIGEFVEETIKQYAEKGCIPLTPHYMRPSQIYQASSENGEVTSLPVKKSLLSWNGREFVPMEAVRVQRKNSPQTLVKLTTSSGLILKLTEEHPVLVDGENGPEWKEAALVKAGDEVYAARKIHIFNHDKFYVIDLVSENRGISVPLSPSTKDHISEALCGEFGSIKRAAELLRFKSWQFTEASRRVNLYDLKRICQLTPALKWEQIRDGVDKCAVRGGGAVRIGQPRLNEDLLYLLGLICADGYIRKRNYGITFINKDIALIKAFEDAYSKELRGRKINKIKDKNGVWYVTVGDPIIYTLAKRFDIKKDPKELIKLPEPLIAAFLMGYFDGDGHCSILKHRHSQEARIILSTVEMQLADRLRLMLRRLGIAGFQDKREGRFDITISSIEDIAKFIEFIGSRSPAKKAAMERVKMLITSRKARGKYFSLAPKVCGKLLKEVCKKHNISITRVDKKRNIYSLAAGRRRATKQKIKEYVHRLEHIVNKEPLLYKIRDFLIDDFYLDPIRKIEKVDATSKYVYDLTVTTSHVFVPEGKFVISNCYDNEAYMNCLSTDSMIMTEDGLKKIAEVKTGDFVYAFDQKTYRLVLKECSGVFDNGVKDVYALSTLHHSIKATSNHPFLVLKRNGRGKTNGFVWKTLAEIKVGDEVVALKNTPAARSHTFNFKKAEKGDYKVNKINRINIPDRSSSDLMKYLGIYVGDGWVRPKKAEVGFAVPQGSEARQTLEILQPRVFGNSVSRSDEEYVYVNSVNLARFIDSLGFKSGAKHKTVPGWVFTLPKEEKEGFVEGLMLSDGYETGNSSRYVSASHDLLKTLRLLIQTMDYRAGKIHQQTKTKGTKCVYRALLKDSTYGYICFSKKRKWKTEKYSSQYRYQNFLIDNEYFNTEKVKAIKHVGKEPTLDLRVEGEHNFIADGIVVHNTGVQRSSATPKGTYTTTSPVGKKQVGKKGFRKNLTEIMVAHSIPYVAQASPSHWNDLVKKVEKALSIEGPKFINVIMPCTLGWVFPTDMGIEIAKLAVETCFWPLYEVENGRYTVNYKPKEMKPLTDFLNVQNRFSHLKKEENKPIVEELQAQVKRVWDDLLKKETLSKA